MRTPVPCPCRAEEAAHAYNFARAQLGRTSGQQVDLPDETRRRVEARVDAIMRGSRWVGPSAVSGGSSGPHAAAALVFAGFWPRRIL